MVAKQKGTIMKSLMITAVTGLSLVGCMGQLDMDATGTAPTLKVSDEELGKLEKAVEEKKEDVVIEKTVDSAKVDSVTPAEKGLDIAPEEKKIEKEKASGVIKAVAPIAIPVPKIKRIDGIVSVASLGVIDGVFYFTAQRSTDKAWVLGRLEKDETEPMLTPIGKLSGEHIVMKGSYWIVSNSDSNLYLSNDAEIVQIDLVSMRAVNRIVSQCAQRNEAPMFKDGSWVQIYTSLVKTCSLTNGDVTSNDAMIDGDTQEVFKWRANSIWDVNAFDGEKIYHYDHLAQKIEIFGSNIAHLNEKKMGNLTFLASESIGFAVEEGNGWFLNCLKEKCDLSSVAIQSK